MTKKETIQIIITVVLSVFLGLLIVRAVKKQKGHTRSAAPSYSFSPQKGVKNDKSVTDKFQELSELEFKRDPFFKQVDQTYQGPVLNGILWDADNPLAIINGKTVNTGSMVDGYAVAEIHTDKVILNDGKRDFSLLLKH